ncbi:sigma-70 family RNA polymerase sigma factor [Azospirillum sp. INR13]|uniref:sigma-70 family RNA polymerase sigma factor n=1 Tax=Azospirillum sp. INR13 TaxID=2596919 RepID=UPI001892661C|nr:sigma-70 family RNA polymerase sigma factor [Azospirillum sp. INR13]MBF5094993.1 sigma-70 family RNA polymerase sigma factor [Azospirillum sp. INR13]
MTPTPDTGFDRTLIACMADLRRFALHLTKDPAQADDLLQDCLERALRYRDRFEPGTNLKAWLCTILKNLHFSACKRVRRHAETEIAEDAMESAPEQDWKVLLRETGDAIRMLAPEHREVIRLVGIEGASYEEAAETLGVAMGTLRSRLCRARRCLRAVEEAEGAGWPEWAGHSSPQPALPTHPASQKEDDAPLQRQDRTDDVRGEQVEPPAPMETSGADHPKPGSGSDRPAAASAFGWHRLGDVHGRGLDWKLVHRLPTTGAQERRMRDGAWKALAPRRSLSGVRLPEAHAPPADPSAATPLSVTFWSTMTC